MPQVRMKSIDQNRAKPLSECIEEFMRRCRLKNLSERTIEYYTEIFQHIRKTMPDIQTIEDFTEEKLETFLLNEMDRGNKTASINTRLRGIFAFLRYCFECGYLERYNLSLIKGDQEIKDPYGGAPGPDGGGRCPGVYTKAKTGKDGNSAEKLSMSEPNKASSGRMPLRMVCM